MNTINIINLSEWQEAASTNPNFPKEAIIKSRQQRLLSICQQSKEQQVAIRLWEGIIDSRGGWAGICLSFKKIVQWAKENDLTYVMIGEDDLLFSAPGAWQYYLDNMPSEFDTYSGGIYSGQIENGRILNGYSGHTLITVHKVFYDEFLQRCDEALARRDHIDRFLGNYAFENNYRVCEPFVCFQLEGYSDNHRRATTHAAFLETMNLFGR